MRTRYWITLTASLILLGGTALGIDFIWKDEQGDHHYKCSGHVVGGRARIKPIGDGMYRVQSVLINRVIRADSVAHAARIACGVVPEAGSTPPSTPTE
jgi:hypothetical protein